MNKCFVAVLQGWYIPRDLKIMTELLLLVLLIFIAKQLYIVDAPYLVKTQSLLSMIW